MSKKLLREKQKTGNTTSVITSEYRLKSQGFSGSLESSDDEILSPDQARLVSSAQEPRGEILFSDFNTSI